MQTCEIFSVHVNLYVTPIAIMDAKSSSYLEPVTMFQNKCVILMLHVIL